MTKYSLEKLALQDIIARNIGQLLVDYRHHYGVTQREISVEVGCNQSRISATEQGKWQPTIASIIDYFIGLGAARVRKEICNDECPCRREAEIHTAELEVAGDSQDGQGDLPGEG